ncbi:MAG: hypothetical protein ACRBK7_08940 [Acidimicrobiales bacterium]
MKKHLARPVGHSPAIDTKEQSNFAQLDHSQPRPTVEPEALPRARADALGQALGHLNLDELRDHHLALAMAVIELAADAGSPLPWTHDDPTVALLRAAANLALTSPDATSSAAADLIERLGGVG